MSANFSDVCKKVTLEQQACVFTSICQILFCFSRTSFQIDNKKTFLLLGRQKLMWESLHLTLLWFPNSYFFPFSRMKEMVLNIDIAPTFLDIAGVNVPRDMDGSSIMKLFRKSRDGRRSKRYLEYVLKLEHS